jgi:putative FmdB family regulatory protein
MPLFEYACVECGNRFELLRGAGQADGPTICDRCSGSRVKRLLSVFAAPRGASDSYDSAPAYSGGCACGGACSCNN